MAQNSFRAPDLLPVLSRGKHRKPRKGACFMELASLLAGERWSDHPSCTHPLLASVARDVNDWTSDAERHKLVPLIPSVIGLTGDDPRIDARIALRCATLALPVAAENRQHALAVGVLACEDVLAELDGRPAGVLHEHSEAALASAPGAARWARSFRRQLPVSLAAFRKHGAPSITRCAVVGIAQACVPDPDTRLRELLTAAIEECAAFVPSRRESLGAHSLDTLVAESERVGVRIRP